MANLLAAPRSHCCSPGPQTVSRPTVPKGVVCGAKAAGLNQSAGPGLLIDGETPGMTLARMLRSPPIWQLVQAGLAIVNGRPVRQLQIPSICQLPRTPFIGAGAEDIILRPRPNGNSYTQLATELN